MAFLNHFRGLWMVDRREKTRIFALFKKTDEIHKLLRNGKNQTGPQRP